jgi:hypothetical protein
MCQALTHLTGMLAASPPGQGEGRMMAEVTARAIFYEAMIASSAATGKIVILVLLGMLATYRGEERDSGRSSTRSSKDLSLPPIGLTPIDHRHYHSRYCLSPGPRPDKRAPLPARGVQRARHLGPGPPGLSHLSARPRLLQHPHRGRLPRRSCMQHEVIFGCLCSRQLTPLWGCR